MVFDCDVFFFVNFSTDLIKSTCSKEQYILAANNWAKLLFLRTSFSSGLFFGGLIFPLILNLHACIAITYPYANSSQDTRLCAEENNRQVYYNLDCLWGIRLPATCLSTCQGLWKSQTHLYNDDRMSTKSLPQILALHFRLLHTF